ncbi:MAG: outer membrane lipoprotein-sorting protein [Trichlorobacter sp.]|uniref:outer membrane lipoprotein-sorting protein n=1 Tax=Trichlorobacter sp. TaxID=2911007 RepID=UPI00256AE879|nr:outer membrane lipoprotein-sorting protein [Trichlorobacter sp.]MDK9718710.1 outer membrane lipoprotein-sorting protein [Trichlorobacter sp.]
MKISLLMTLLISLVFSGSAVALDGQQLLKQIDRNLNPESYESYRKLINIEPDGSRKEFTLYTIKKGVDKVASLFLAPASDKGRTTLRLGENMWLLIPNVGKPVRITSLQSVVGGVFNNADILQLDYDAEYTVQKVEEKGTDYLLHLKAKNRSVAYDRLRIWADKGKKLPVKIECLTEAGMLIKTIYFKDVKDFGGFSRPATIETDSPLYKGYKSVMLFAKLKKRSFKDEVFTLNGMATIDSLR